MTDFAPHSIETAPEPSKAMLENAKRTYGQIPNLLGAMAEAPALLEAYTSTGKIFDNTSLSSTERQVILIAVSVVNECVYCVAAHSVIASMQQVPDEVVDAVREDRPIADARLEALRTFATQVVDQRGFVSDGQVRSFLDAGYTKAQVLEVLVGVGMKTLSNYTNHIAKTELDAAFASRAWRAPRAA